MITRKQFAKLISEMEIGDKVIIKKSNGNECVIKKINILQYHVRSDTIEETVTNIQYEVLL